MSPPAVKRRPPPPSPTARPADAWLLYAALFLLGVALFIFPLTLHHPLIDPDEGLHAAIAQEMVERGDYIMPRLLGKPFLDKPVFFFWAMAGSLRLLGFSERAVRAPGLA